MRNYVLHEASLRKREICQTPGWKEDDFTYAEWLELKKVPIKCWGIRMLGKKLDVDEAFLLNQRKADGDDPLTDGELKAIAEMRAWIEESKILHAELRSYDPQRDAFAWKWMRRYPYEAFSDPDLKMRKRLDGAIYASERMLECATREQADQMRRWLWTHKAPNRWFKWGERKFLKKLNETCMANHDHLELLARKEEIFDAYGIQCEDRR